MGCMAYIAIAKRPSYRFVHPRRLTSVATVRM